MPPALLPNETVSRNSSVCKAGSILHIDCCFDYLDYMGQCS